MATAPVRVPVIAEPLRWGLVAAFALLLLALSLAPADPIRGSLGLDATGVAVVEALVYAALTLTLVYAWQPSPIPGPRPFVVFAIVLAYGIAMEAVQFLVPTRRARLEAGIADVVGAATAWLWDGLLRRMLARP